MRTLVPLLFLALSGCTAVKSSVHLVQAEQAVARAEQHNADDEAIYEYTMAVRYLEKAREENGYSDFKDSSELSKASSEWADKAIKTVEMGGPQYRPKPAPVAQDAETGEDALPDGSDDALEGDLPESDVPDAGDDLLEEE